MDDLNINDNWTISCLDGESLEPPAEELEKAYGILAKGGMLELKWKCPGRRAISPTVTEEQEIRETTEKETPTKSLDFDFMDESPLQQIRVRNQNATPKGSAKKKTTNFAGVIDSMKKHGRLLQKESSN